MDPISFISHFRVKPGRSEDVRTMAAMVSEQLAAEKPGTVAFLPYLGDDGSTFTLRRVQAMLGLSRHIVAGLIDAGFVTPTRGQHGEEGVLDGEVGHGFRMRRGADPGLTCR